MTAPQGRIPLWDEIRERLDLGQPHPFLISQIPELYVLVEPTVPAVGLLAVADPTSIAQPRPARGIRVQQQGPRSVAVWVDDADLLELGWSFLARLASALLHGENLFVSLFAELDEWRDLVARMATTRVSAAIGLLGELAVLKAALELGRDVSSWVGRDGGPIDFRFSPIECEVKTTSGGRHEHIIHSDDQLQPSVGATLHVVSLRVAASEASTGSSVATLVSDVLQFGVDRTGLDGTLALRGVRYDDPATTSRYVLRTTPFAVEASQLPAITPGLLGAALGPESSRIRDVSYRLDLEGMTPSVDPFLSQLVATVTL